jgi:hypothetical protein
MRNIIIAIAAFFAVTAFGSYSALAYEGDFKAGGGLVFDFDDSELGIDVRALYYFAEKLAIQGEFIYYFAEGESTVLGFSPSIRYDFVQLSKLTPYARVGYTLINSSLNDESQNLNRINGVLGFEFPLSSFNLYGELDLGYQFSDIEALSGLRSQFHVGVLFDL